MSAKSQKCKNFKTCHAWTYRANISGLCLGCYRAKEGKAADARRPEPAAIPPHQAVAEDHAKRRASAELSGLKDKYKVALKTIEGQERELRAMNVLGAHVDTHTIAARQGSGTSEGTVVMVASDWHIEENVGSEVGGLNRYNLEIATQRVTKFFQSGVRLVKLLQQDIKIPNIILPLLGDFISNDIHEEFPEINELSPTHAIVRAQNQIIAGIEFILEHTQAAITIPCHSGNHARTTRTTRFSSENGHSLEYLMYLHLAAYFRNHPRVTFIIPDGYHSYLKVYDTTIRFHHGHAVKYGGGVGGIYIPVNKAIAQWDKARHADLDVFGHFHQMRDGGNFICNGSLIGYNAFALAIKADYEPPKQALFLIDKKRGRTCTWPILVQ